MIIKCNMISQIKYRFPRTKFSCKRDLSGSFLYESGSPAMYISKVISLYVPDRGKNWQLKRAMTGQRGEKNGFMSDDRVWDSNKESVGSKRGVYSGLTLCRPQLSPQPVRILGNPPVFVPSFPRPICSWLGMPGRILVFSDRHSPALLLGR